MTKARLRITGLVRAQRHAEEALRHGLSPEEIQAFQTWAANIVAQVEDACRQYQLSPEDLPRPSLQAYQFLKTLDAVEINRHLAQKPRKKKKKARAQAANNDAENGTVRLRNLIRVIENLHQMLYAIIQAWPSQGNDLRLASQPIRANIKKHIKTIEAICRTANSSPQRLPDPSWRAYEWLRFLSQENHLIAHLKALHQSAVLVESLRPKFPARLTDLTMEVRFYNLPGLYRSQGIDGRLLLVTHEAFIGAPPEVMENMLWAALLPKQRQKGPSSIVRQFADTQSFTDLAQKVNGGRLAANDERSRGRHHDLKAAFQRVNHRYFKDQMTAPKLVWGQRLSRRKLGHYQPATDTIQVSRTLDNPEVPGFIVEFIVYHELLHKQIGVKIAGGRRYSHTPAFKQAERLFDRFQEAQDFLNNVGENLEL
jgi:hypothetical protein